MSDDDICKLPVWQLADKDCMLIMWEVNQKAESGPKVTKAWGFECVNWYVHWLKVSTKNHKILHPFAGNYTKDPTESARLCRKGRITYFRDNIKSSALLVAPRGRHSEKPKAFYEHLKQYLGEERYEKLNKIELFCRTPQPGWDYWGNAEDIKELGRE
jgi:N6-adenosine-specific RNA methylase IME4